MRNGGMIEDIVAEEDNWDDVVDIIDNESWQESSNSSSGTSSESFE